jgi:hypothetical protein
MNLTSVGPSPADGSYGDNFRQLGKPMEVRRLNPIMHARPHPTSMPTLTGLAATLSDLSPPPPHHPTPTARLPAPTRLHPVKSARQRPDPTIARCGRLLHATSSSATGASLSSSTPRSSCRPGPGPVKPTCHCLYAPAVLLLHAPVCATSISSTPWLLHAAA